MTELTYSDYATVPAGFLTEVCRCSSIKGYTHPQNFATDNTLDPSKYTLKFDWWVCNKCLKPAPLNALNARLIRECELCEEPYLISTYPDRMNLCEECL